MKSFEKSKSLFERSKAVSPGGVHSPVRAFKGVGGTPLFIESAKGSQIRDVDGNFYTDYCQSWGPLIFGHRDEEMEQAVQGALSRGWSYGTAEPYSLELAELITNEIPWVEKIRFVNSGTEAVMSALRVARGATGRNKILKFEGCYHGHVDSLLIKAGSGLAEMACSDSAGVSDATASETLILPLDNEDRVRSVFEKRGREIAAVIIEPLPANNGLLIQRPEFLKTICDEARRNGTLVIFDEVISGFRIGFQGMAGKLKNELGIEPDLVTYGKVIGGGFPVGAYGGRTDLMDQVAPSGPVYQAGTLSGNPVAMVAGLTALKKLLRDPPYSRLESLGKKLAQEIEQTASNVSPIPLHVQTEGSLFWIVLGSLSPLSNGQTIRRSDQIPQTQIQHFPKLFHALLKQGHYLAPSAYEVGLLSTAHAEEESAKLAQAIATAMKEIQ